MKIKIKIMLAVLCFQFGISASAYDFEIDGIYYEIVSFDDWTCRIVSGDVVYTGDIVIPNEVTYNGRTLKVTEIGDDAFNGCADLKTLSIEDGTETLSLGSSNGTNALFSDCSLETLYVGRNLSYETIYSPFYEEESLLTKVTIGPYVTEIGDYMFYGCTGLTEVTIPSSVVEIGKYAFSGCTGLTEVTIPSSVVEIGEYAFSGCTGLSNITIPNSVTSIGRDVFYRCTGLINVTIPNSVTSIGKSAFHDCTSLIDVTIPNSVTSIDESAFHGCTSLIDVTIPNSVKRMGVGVFGNCTSLTSMTIPNSVGIINKGMFEGCTSLTDVIIGSSVSSIGARAFLGCSSLASITIPKSVYSIEYNSFDGCSSLKTLVFEDGEIWDIGVSLDYHPSGANGVFCDCPLETLYLGRNLNYITYEHHGYSPFYNIETLKEVTIGGSASRIGDNAFMACVGLTDISIPNSVKSIGDNAFSGCTGITNISIPNSVEEIGNCAFSGCTGITNISIPNSVEEIGNCAFEDCPNIRNLVFEEGTKVLSLGNDTINGNGLFYDCPLDTLYIGRNLSYATSADKGYSPFYNIKTLKSVMIGRSVTEIGDNAFSGCDSLARIYSLNPQPPTCATGFETKLYVDTYLYVLPGTLNAYQEAAPWKNFFLLQELGQTVFEVDGVFYGIVPYYEHECWVVAGNTEYTGEVVIPNQVEHDGKTLNVVAIKDNAFQGCESLNTLTIEDGQQALSLGISPVGQGLFQDCPLETLYMGRPLIYKTSDGCPPFYQSLRKVTIGNSMTQIGYDTFMGCSGLKTLIIKDGSEALSLGTIYEERLPFSDCPLETLHLGRNLSYIIHDSGISPFSQKETLKEVTLSNFVTEIKSYAFKGCVNLKVVIIPNSVTSIGDYTFYGCTGLSNITIPNSVTSIGDYTFYGCTGLSNITIPNSVTSIGSYTFYGCTGLSNITIPNSVTSIGSYTFYGCTGLSNITIPNSVTSIGSYTFYGCTSLTEMIIPNSVNKINEGVFKGCTNLRRLIVEDGAEELQWNCYSTSSDGRPFSGTSLETLYLGRNLVNDSPFSFIESLKDVTIGNSVERISNYVFYGCTGLTEITIPNSVTEIGHESFYGCTNLTKITISNSVTEIGYRTFAGCSNLKTIYSLNLQPPTYDIFSDPAFEQTCYSSAVLYVPIGSLNAYQTTIPWSNFGNIQEFDPVTGIDNTKMEVEAENEETTIYDLQGRRLSRSQRGINIINGKKVLVTSHK